MNEDQSPKQEAQDPAPDQLKKQDVNQSQSQSPQPSEQTPKKPHNFILAIVAILFFLIVGGGAVYFMLQEEDSVPVENSQATEETEKAQQPTEEKSAPLDEAEAVLDETDYYTLIVPEDFERVGDRIFTFTGQPEETFSYLDSTSGDYFEVNINPADSGLNADFVWTYIYTDGDFTLDMSDSTVCLPEDDDWCEFSGANDSLDSAIFAQPETLINGQRVYFTFGNTLSQSVGDLSYAEQFLENITF